MTITIKRKPKKTYIDTLSQNIFKLLKNVTLTPKDLNVVLNYNNRKKIMDKIKETNHDQWGIIIKKMFQSKTIRNSFKLADKHGKPKKNTYQVLEPWLENELVDLVIFFKKYNEKCDYTTVHNWTSDLYKYFKTRNDRVYYKILSDFDMQRESIVFSNACFIKKLSHLEKTELEEQSDRLHLNPFVLKNSNFMLGITTSPEVSLRKCYEELNFLILSLRLFKEGWFDYSRTFTTTSKKWEAWRGGAWKEMSENSRKKYILNKKECKSFIQFYNWLITSKDLSQKVKNINIVLRRFNASFERESVEDELLDLIICLEAIYSEGPGDLSWKVSTRCAKFLKSVAGMNILEIRGFVKTMYKKRNDIVHGSKESKKIKTEELIKLSAITRASINKWIKLMKKDSTQNIYNVFDFGISTC